MEEPLLGDLPASPNAKKVVDLLEDTFQRNVGDEKYRAGMEMAVPGAGEMYGIKVPILRSMATKILRAYKEDREALRTIALESWGRGSREHQLVALFILHKVKLDPTERWALGVRFLPDVSNWESCDQLCMALLGEALAQDPQHMDGIEEWIGDENLWVRRAALVAPVYLRRAKYSAETALDLDRRTLNICEALLDDTEKYIRKAVDWSIRQVIDRHYDLARDWMLAQAGTYPSRTARTTLKLASKKLTDEDRNRFIRSLEE